MSAVRGCRPAGFWRQDPAEGGRATLFQQAANVMSDWPQPQEAYKATQKSIEGEKTTVRFYEDSGEGIQLGESG